MNIRSFLVDTNILSEIEKPRPNPAITEWAQRKPTLILSYPVVLEIRWGIRSLERTNPDRAESLQNWLDAAVAAAGDTMPALTPAVAELQATMMEVPRLTHLWLNNPSRRRRPPGQDLCIAAIAIEYHLPIATLNTRDFIEINGLFPLPGVFNPATRKWAVQWVPHARRRLGLGTIEAAANFDPSELVI